MTHLPAGSVALSLFFFQTLTFFQQPLIGDQTGVLHFSFQRLALFALRIEQDL